MALRRGDSGCGVAGVQLRNSPCRSSSAATSARGESAAAAAAASARLLPMLCASLSPPCPQPRTARQRRTCGPKLCKAAERGHVDDVRLQLALGADVNFVDAKGFTPLMCATFYGHAAVVELLLERGADARMTGSRWGMPLHVACQNDHSGQCLAQLIAAGAPLDARNIDGATPLHCAASWNNADAVERLLEAGASKSLIDNDGRIPARVAATEQLRAVLAVEPVN